MEVATAAALSDMRRLHAVGRLIDRLVRHGSDDPLAPLPDRTAADACQTGLTPDALPLELAAYAAERRS